MAKVISLLAGPGAGKSSCAAYIFSQLKARGENVELVQEYIKDWAWENRVPSPYDQFYILGKQIRKESMLLDKVDYIITDSPVWLVGYYTSILAPHRIREGIEACIEGYYQQAFEDGHKHLFVWVNRLDDFDERGRFHSKEESLLADKQLRSFLSFRSIDLLEVSPDYKLLDSIIERF